MTQEKESQVEAVWSACVGVYAPCGGRACYYSGQPQWLPVVWAWRIGERLQPSFWCSAWVGNLNTKMHSIDSWPCKRFFNKSSVLFCFHFFFFPFLFLKLLQILLGKRKWSWWLAIFFCMRFYFWQEWKGSAGLHEHFCFRVSVFLICQWLMVVVWTLTQNTDHGLREWRKNLLRSGFVLASACIYLQPFSSYV